MKALSRILSSPNEHWLLGLMLLMLHVSIWEGFGTALSRSMMLAHLGLFLIWQPLWRSDQQLKKGNAIIFVLLTVAFVNWINWWLVFVWLLLLIGIIGGRVFVDRSERFAYMITLLALISEFLIGCITPMFSVPLNESIYALFYYGLVIPPLVLLFIPSFRMHDDSPRSVDFLHGLTMSSLSAILALGGLLVMYTTDSSYAVALFQILLVIALFLFAISWLLTPHPGFSGLAQLWSRYLLNIGTPFEHWLTGLSQLAKTFQTPGAFLEAAMGQLEELPWVEGVQWSCKREKGEAGSETQQVWFYHGNTLEAGVYTTDPSGAALVLHGKLLLQIIEHFYSAKLAQQELARHAHVQAIYETGARLTHDIKNLLQSLQVITSAIQQSKEEDAAEVQQLLMRQLPNLSQRLNLALDKLQSPGKNITADRVALSLWWDAMLARHARRDIFFESKLSTDHLVPVDCLDSISANLLENARLKRNTEPELEIRVRLITDEKGFCINICDDGDAIPEETARVLFEEPVLTSDSGLGIGLYQAARQAGQFGFTLRLATNKAGNVCFELAGKG
ncbi:MAG: HAMP domain-containing histidine kinase [Gammaproteobacteria bacterium]|nr:HAMP domain-containing histidine kinase [Gammaproteobacteria bacterium]